MIMCQIYENNICRKYIYNYTTDMTHIAKIHSNKNRIHTLVPLRYFDTVIVLLLDSISGRAPCSVSNCTKKPPRYTMKPYVKTLI